MLDNAKNGIYNKRAKQENAIYGEKGDYMLITVEHAEKVRVKRGRLDLTKGATAKKLNVTPRTLKLIEAGNYDAPKRIYESVMNWLVEDY